MKSLKKQIRLKESEIVAKKHIALAEAEQIKETVHNGLTSPITLCSAFVVGFCVSAGIIHKLRHPKNIESQSLQSQDEKVESATAPVKFNFSHVLTFINFIADVALIAQRFLNTKDPAR